jgi:WD40 repeat protein
MFDFKRNLAVVIGINDYENVTPLGTAVNDAKKLAEILRSQPEPHNYEIVPLEEAQPGIDCLKNLLDITLPNVIKPTNQDRLLFYFAGHGYPADSVEGPAGYLVPRDAKPGEMESFLSMEYLHNALLDLDCRHLLIILDCCFAGSFRWAATRHIAAPTVMYKERFERYTKNNAWQVITSAAHDQKAFDILFDNRAVEGVEHSPFAEALFEALEKGTADVNGDGIVTATELYLHLSETLRDRTLELRQQQVPGLWPLRKHDKGEFIFILNKDFNPKDLADAPPIDPENNPYRGLESFEAAQSKLFFGRDELIKELYDRITLPDAETNSDRPFTVVLGISGSGKSSLVKAGLIPHLDKKEAGLWQILEPMRPGTTPFLALAKAILSIANDSVSSQDSIEHLSQLLQNNQTHFSQTIAAWHELIQNQGKKLLLVIDQFEELITQSQSSQIQQSQDSVEQKSEWQQFLDVLAIAIQAHAQHLRIVVTLRSDFEPRFLNSTLKEYWSRARFPVRAMRADELRQAIEKPAEEKALFFEPSTLVDRLIEEVGQMPGALPLLSFTLSELYNQLAQKWKEGDTNRALTLDDKGQEGGIAGSLTRRANEVYQQIAEAENLGEAAQRTMRRVMLRMLTLEGGETTRRRVPESELVYPTLEENERVRRVVNSLVDARLLVKGQLETGEPYIEPAHDYLIRGWITLQDWIAQNQQSILLRNRLHFDLVAWRNDKTSTDHLWISNAQVATLNEVLLSDMRYSLNDDEEKFVAKSIEKAQEVNTEKERQVLEAFLLNSELLWKDNQQLESLIAITKAGKRLQAAKSIGLAPKNEIQVRMKLHETLYQRIREINRFSGHSQIVNSVAFSPDGEIIVSGGDRTVKLWDRKGKLLSTFDTEYKWDEYSVSSVAFSPNSQMIVLALGTKLDLLNREGKSLVTNDDWQHDEEINSVAFSPDNQTIASASTDGTVKLWDIKLNWLCDFTGHDDDVDHIDSTQPQAHTVSSVAFDPINNHIIASGGWDGVVRLWNRQGQLLQKFPHNFSSDAENSNDKVVGIRSVAFSKNGEIIASAYKNGIMKLWNREGEILHTWAAHNGYIHSIVFSPDDKTIASIGGQTIELWDYQGKLLQNFINSNFVSSIAFSPDGEVIASGDRDCKVKLWSCKKKKPLICYGFDTNIGELRDSVGVNSMVFSSDSQTIAVAHNNGIVNLWNQKGERLKSIKAHDSSATSVAFSPNGETLATGSNCSVKLWNQQGEFLVACDWSHDRTDFVKSIAFSPDGQMLVSGGDRSLNFWDRQGKLLSRSDSGGIYSLAFSPDGQTIALAGTGHYVRLWDFQQRKYNLYDFRHDDSFRLYSVAFSPNGEVIAAAGTYDTVKLWNRQGQLLCTLKLMSYQPSKVAVSVNSVAFSSDGNIIAAGGENGTIKLWNQQWETLLTCNRPYGSFDSLAFAPDGQTFASGGKNNNFVTLWDIGLDSLVAKSCEWLYGYLNFNPNVSDSDRKLLEDFEQ